MEIYSNSEPFAEKMEEYLKFMYDIWLMYTKNIF